jgi:hypothetical protein
VIILILTHLAASVASSCEVQAVIDQMQPPPIYTIPRGEEPRGVQPWRPKKPPQLQLESQ